MDHRRLRDYCKLNIKHDKYFHNIIIYERDLFFNESLTIDSEENKKDELKRMPYTLHGPNVILRFSFPYYHKYIEIL